MINDNDREWSKLHCGVTHFRRDKVTHTVMAYPTFCEAYKFSWITYSFSPTYTFFVGDKKPDSVHHENTFYGSSKIGFAIDNAIALSQKVK